MRREMFAAYVRAVINDATSKFVSLILFYV